MGGLTGRSPDGRPRVLQSARVLVGRGGRLLLLAGRPGPLHQRTRHGNRGARSTPPCSSPTACSRLACWPRRPARSPRAIARYWVGPTFGLGFKPTVARRPFGPTPRSFGHFGTGGAVGFADPDAGVAFGYVMNHVIPRWQSTRNRALIDAVYRSL